MTPYRVLVFSIFSLLTVLACAGPLAAGDSCQPVFDALTKIATSPSHSYTTTTSGGKSRDTETIMTQGKKYIRVSGKWMAPGVTTADVVAQEKEAEKNGNSACQVIRSEAVKGEAATVYSLRRDVQGSKEDSQIWISKANGMALRAEQDIDMGGGKEHRSARFEYSNVHAPI